MENKEASDLKLAVAAVLIDCTDLPDVNSEWSVSNLTMGLIYLLTKKNKADDGSDGCPYKLYGSVCDDHTDCDLKISSLDCDKDPEDLWKTFVGIMNGGESES